jgi:hypothetical protein
MEGCNTKFVWGKNFEDFNKKLNIKIKNKKNQNRGRHEKN